MYLCGISYLKSKTMRLFSLASILLVILAVSSCTVSKQVKQLNYDAQKAYETSDYGTALSSYEQIISIKTDRKQKVDGVVYRNAGLSAWKLGETGKTIEYLEVAKQKDAANAPTYSSLAKAYLEIDNLSREINNLQEYVERYPEGEEIDEVRTQLFIAYVESNNWHYAIDLWDQLKPSHREEAKVLVGYMKTLRALDRNENIITLAKQINRIDPNNLDALQVLAQEYYRMAEDSYQAEMKAYENNRTNRQYRQLLAALEVINSNFRTSRDYFEKLYELDPNPRYATFLGNIYTRFDNKQRADYYYRKAKGQ